MSTPWSWYPGPAFPDTVVADPARTWKRKFWGSEHAFARPAQVTPGRADIIVACDISGCPGVTHAHVRAAMRALRFEHPNIAATMAWSADQAEGRFQYEAPAGEEQVRGWLDAVVVPRGGLVREGVDVRAAIEVLSSELSHARAPRTPDQFKLYHLLPSPAAPDEHGFLLYMKHSLFDGVAAWQALDCFLHELSTILGRAARGEPEATALEWGTEHARLARPVSDRVDKPWAPADMHADWPTVTRMTDVLSRPTTSFGLPDNPAGTEGASTCLARAFPPPTTQRLLRAARAHAVRLFAVQWASVLLACMRLSPPATSAGEVRVVAPFTPVNLRARLATRGRAELVSALGFGALEARDLGRFRAAVVEGGDVGLVGAVWTLAGEIQAQLAEQESWHDDAVRYAPGALQALGKFFADPPPPVPLRTPGVTNFGVIDSLLSPSYPVSDTQALTVTHAIFHNVHFHYCEQLFQSMLHAYTWRGTLYYTLAFAEGYAGESGGTGREGRTLLKLVDEIERITYLLAAEDGAVEKCAARPSPGRRAQQIMAIGAHIDTNHFIYSIIVILLAILIYLTR
ncbi:hypothetical protein HWV62_14334 [Athelia sp. TMB]|nr:hypothetical protein HWV62_14334 [Athelia sp. TMB]